MLEGRTKQPVYELETRDKRFVGYHLIIAIAAVFVGSTFGPLQALEFSNVDLYQYLDPVLKSLMDLLGESPRAVSYRRFAAEKWRYRRECDGYSGRQPAQ